MKDERKTKKELIAELVITHFTYPVEDLMIYYNMGHFVYTPLLAIWFVRKVGSWKKIWFPIVWWIGAYVAQGIILLWIIGSSSA